MSILSLLYGVLLSFDTFDMHTIECVYIVYRIPLTPST